MRQILVLVTMLAAALLGPNRALAQLDEPYEKPPINYSTTKPHDAVTELEAKPGAALPWAGGGKMIVQRLLKELRIPMESQVLVFSKTSFQRQAINPTRPRAIYFSDNCYVGWVPDGLVEVATIDPRLGPVFYSFDPNAEHPHARFPGLPPHARLSEESADGIERTRDRVVGLRQRQTRFRGRCATGGR